MNDPRTLVDAAVEDAPLVYVAEREIVEAGVAKVGDRARAVVRIASQRYPTL